MGIQLDDVKVWSMLSGIGCIVTGSSRGWHWTACHRWRTGTPQPRPRPPRICRKCRAALTNLRPAQPEARP